MTKAEKEARELVDRYRFPSMYFTDGDKGAMFNAKQTATLVVDDMLNVLNQIKSNGISNVDDLLNHISDVQKEVFKLARK